MKKWLVFLTIAFVIVLVLMFIFWGYISYVITGKINQNLCNSKMSFLLAGAQGIYSSIYSEVDMKDFDMCVRIFAALKQRPDLCYQAKTDRGRDGCLLNLAFNYNVPEACKQVTLSDYKAQCDDRFK